MQALTKVDSRGGRGAEFHLLGSSVCLRFDFHRVSGNTHPLLGGFE